MLKLIEHTINTIDQLIKDQLPESKYQFELYDLITNTRHFRGLDEPFHWGSVYKLFVVAEIIKMSEDGLLDLDDDLVLHKDLFRNGNGNIKFMTHLDKLTYIDACKMVMAISDNLCADELLNKVGFERLNNLFQKANCRSSKLVVNLDTMVKNLFEGLNMNDTVQFFQSENYFEHFENSLTKLLKDNYTTVQDINKVFLFIFDQYLNDRCRTIFMECVLIPSIHTRLAMYTNIGHFFLKGKTGALGSATVNNENAAIIHKDTKEIFGYFAINTKDNRKRYFQSNDTIGLIGFEICKLYEQLYDLKT